MKICIVALDIVPYFRYAKTARFGGAEVQAAALARAFSESGADVSFVVKDLPEDVSLPFPAHNAYDSNRGIRGTRFFHPRVPGIYKALTRADADVYYQHCAGMITGETAFFCRQEGKTFVYGGGSDSDFDFRRLLISGLRDKLLYLLGVKLADGIVAQNRHQRELCENNFHKQAKVIPMVIDTEGPGDISTGEKVMWAGPVRKVKRPELFLQLAKRFPETEFVLIGGFIEVETGFAGRIREQADEIPNLTCTGRIPHADVIERLKEAAVLVNTSSVEGFPNTYLEAWKSGVPVISFSDVDGYIEGEGIGAVCGDLETMESRLRSILEDPALRISMGKRARDFVLSTFSAGVVADEYLSFFEELRERRYPGARC